jgi:GntR family phosphonate transport system transcriptional regulator
MRPTGVIVWRKIEEALQRDIADGAFAAGAKLPIEKDLATRFGVNRHTVRRALASLRERGLISIEPGRGVFARGPAISYPVGHRVRFSENIGHLSSFVRGEMIGSRHVAAPERIALDLDVPVGSTIIAVDDLRRIDGSPLTFTTHYFPLPRFADMPVLFAETGSITRSLAQLDVHDYLRRLTRIHARGATQEESTTLGCDLAAPILVVECINADVEGRPIEFGYSRSVGETMEMVFDNRK